MPDQPEEACVLDLFCQDRQEHLVIERVEAARDVAFDEPDRALPFPRDLRERGVTAPVRTESTMKRV